jgi:hypothetical protein
MEVNGKIPALALIVDVTTAFFHCAKCIVRSNLWSSDLGAASDDRLLAEAMVAHGDLPVTVDEMQQIIEDDEMKRLY